jgi:predicted DNA-binding transcriptional regulator AlpA
MARKKPATTATTPPAAPESDPLLTRAYVSEDSGFTPETLSRWHSAGYGPPAIRIGRSIRYRASEYRKWKASLSAGAVE